MPAYLYADNPHLKVLFIVRNPIGRTESHYRYGYQQQTFSGQQKSSSSSTSSSQESINDLVDLALDDRKGGLMEVFHLANASSYSGDIHRVPSSSSSPLEVMVERYLKGFRSKDFKHYQRAASIISHSLYFPAIFHWIKVFGRSNIKVVAMEWFSPESLPLPYKLSKIQKLGLHGNDLFVDGLDILKTKKQIQEKKVNRLFLKVVYADIYRY